MLFYTDLDKLVFHKNESLTCDELVIISGYVGPNPINRLQHLPLKSTVIYGMYGSDGIQQSLHNALLKEHNISEKVQIKYSPYPVHTKCYVWKNEGKIVSALIGSANFSTNGLTTPYKEVLVDVNSDTFQTLQEYMEIVLNRTIECTEAVVSKNKRLPSRKFDDNNKVYDSDICSMPLYIMNKQLGIPEVPTNSGLNWGLAKLNGSHVNINDAYIRIGSDLIEHYPNFFPQKQEAPKIDKAAKANHRHNDNIEILWDDGTSMIGLLEGSLPVEVNGQKIQYPKQISTTPSKAELGKYFRKRLGVKEGVAITYEDLKRYGRTTVDVSLQGEGIYYFDFSVSK